MCEMLFTSDKEFFENIGEQETKRYFEESYKFFYSYTFPPMFTFTYNIFTITYILYVNTNILSIYFFEFANIFFEIIYILYAIAKKTLIF